MSEHERSPSVPDTDAPPAASAGPSRSLDLVAAAPPSGPPPALPCVRETDLYAALLADARTDNTRAARAYDVAVLRQFLGVSDPSAACALLISRGRGSANAVALAFRRHEMARGMAAATVNRRLATLRRVVTLARRFDLCEWVIDVEDLRDEKYRDTRGPGDEGWRLLWAAASAAGDAPKARRDRALLRILHDNGLRVGEAVGLDWPADVDLAGARLAIRGKGKSSKVWVTTSPACVALVVAWLVARGRRPGPLFTSKPRIDDAGRGWLAEHVAGLRADAVGVAWGPIADGLNSRGLSTPLGLPWTGRRLRDHFGRELAPPRRLPERAVNALVHALAGLAGIERAVNPHGIRHQAITRVLDLTNGNVRIAQRFARHANPATTMRYDDNRADLAGEMTRLLGDDD
jgi:integrase/recombinase XerC